MEKGFTLIEIVITLAIILILTGISFAYYNGLTQNKKLERESQRLINILHLAQIKSSSSDIRGATCDNFSGFSVSVSPSSYSLNLCCDATCSSPQTIKTIDFSNNVVSQDTATIIFKPLSKGIDSITDVSITLKNNTVSRCQTVTITPAGVVDINSQSSC